MDHSGLPIALDIATEEDMLGDWQMVDEVNPPLVSAEIAAWQESEVRRILFLPSASADGSVEQFNPPLVSAETAARQEREIRKLLLLPSKSAQG